MNALSLENSKRSEIGILMGVFLLSACAGDNEQIGASDLYGVYEIIERGMTEIQVNAVIGSEPQRRQPDGKDTQILTWETDAKTYRHITQLDLAQQRRREPKDHHQLPRQQVAVVLSGGLWL